MISFKHLTLSAFAIATFADQAYAQSPTPLLPPYDPTWTGFYAGASFGSGAVLERATSNPGSISTLNIDGLAGGGVSASVHGGYDYQVVPKALVGLLIEGSWSNMGGTATAQVPGAGATINSRADLGFAIMARTGVLTTPSSLVYAMAGYAGQNFHTTGWASAGGAAANFTRDDYFNGWTVGMGFQKLLRGGWSTKIEYRYSQFESKYMSAGDLTLQPFMHTARVGLTYHFGGGHESSEAPPRAGWRDWTGVYGGVAGGAGMMINKTNASFSGASTEIDNGGQGLLGSVFVGGDYQIGEQFVIGVLGDATWPGMQSMLTAGGGGVSATLATRPNMSWTAAGRIGWLAMPSTLLYVLAGYTSQSFSSTGYDGSGNVVFSSDDQLGGFVIGPGFELMIAPGWSTRFEYRYSQFESRTLSNGITLQPLTHTVRAGLAYKIN